MNRAFVQFSGVVTLLGAATVSDAVLSESLGLAPLLVAADGAARRALQAGVMPTAVIGDLDSLDAETRARIPAERLLCIPEQDSTDFDKALRNIDAPLVLAVGFTGQRLDHELAVYNALVRHADRRVIVVGEQDICCHLPARLALNLAAGTRVSLFPMAQVTGRATGLRWPIETIDFAPWGRVGTSNETVACAVTFDMDGPGMLLILPRTQLRPLVRALMQSPVLG